MYYCNTNPQCIVHNYKAQVSRRRNRTYKLYIIDDYKYNIYIYFFSFKQNHCRIKTLNIEAKQQGYKVIHQQNVITIHEHMFLLN